MTAARGAIEAEESRLLTLLGRVLRPNDPHCLADEQPAIFGPAATGHICSINKDGAPVAGAACVARVMTTPRGRMKIGLIGSVATDPRARKQGHGAAVVDACEQYLLGLGCSTVLLWADVPEFYQKRGYVFAGTEYIYLVPPLEGWTSPGTVERYQSEDLHSIEQLRLYESSRSDRPRAESAFHYESAGTEMYCFRETTGRTTAYAAFGRGSDLCNTVHEIGGSVAGIISILKYIIEVHRLESLTILVSPHRTDLIEILESCGIERRTGPLGMLRCLDVARLANVVLKQLPNGTTLKIEYQSAVFEYQQKTIALTATELLHAVIGDAGKRDVLRSVESQLCIPRIVNLPMEPAFGGFDSI